MRKLHSHWSLFSRKEGHPLAPRSSGPAAAEVWRNPSSWGSQVDLADKLDKGLSLSRSSTGDESELWDDNEVISLTSSDPATSALPRKSRSIESESYQSSCPAYDELLEVMERTTARFQHTSYANIEGMRENGYDRMPPIEETLASYFSFGETSWLPPCHQSPFSLNGRAYTTAGQAVASLHTMAVLQAYQADLLKDLDKGQGLFPDEVSEFRRTTDLALQAATAMGRSMVAIVVTERHLWVNLADIGRKEKGFLLSVPVLPSELFGTSVEMLRSLGMRPFIPRALSPNIRGVLARPGLRIRDMPRRLVAARAPPPPTVRTSLLMGPLLASDVSILDRIWKARPITATESLGTTVVVPCLLGPRYITATPGPVGPSISGSPMAMPATYAGEAAECSGFLLQINLFIQMQPQLFPLENAKVAFLISLLTGKALQWAKAIWDSENPIIHSYEQFTTHFSKVFSTTTGPLSTSDQHFRLQQGTASVNDYTLHFRTLAVASGWNETALLGAYRQGLNPDIRTAMALYDDSIGLESFLQRTTRVSQCLAACQPSVTAPQPA
ncbi:hypothetical protein M9458_054363 [Cirrhinus mrigala]